MDLIKNRRVSLEFAFLSARRNFMRDKFKSSDAPGPSSGKKKTKFKYKLHPDPDFDPLEYLISKEIKENVLAQESFKREIKKLRFGIYRAYGKLFNRFTQLVETFRKSSKFHSNMEDRFRFSQFLENRIVNL